MHNLKVFSSTLTTVIRTQSTDTYTVTSHISRCSPLTLQSNHRQNRQIVFFLEKVWDNNAEQKEIQIKNPSVKVKGLF